MQRRETSRNLDMIQLTQDNLRELASMGNSGSQDMEARPTKASKVMADNELLTKAEIAKRLKKDTRTIDNWMRRGILPYYKLGRTVAFRWSDVLRHFEAHFRVIEGR